MNVSRRKLLGRAAALAGASAIASSVFGRDALAKMQKQQAAYQDQPKGEQRCDGCVHFQPPSSCRLVEGDISPSGWCRFFTAKPKSG